MRQPRTGRGSRKVPARPSGHQSPIRKPIQLAAWRELAGDDSCRSTCVCQQPHSTAALSEQPPHYHYK